MERHQSILQFSKLCLLVLTMELSFFSKKNIQMINQYCGNLCLEIEKKIHEVDGEISNERKRPDNLGSTVLV